MNKTTFAVFLGSRGFFPSAVIKTARIEMKTTLEKLGHHVLMMDENSTANGAVESPAEGRMFAEFLVANRKDVDGIIMTLPNFGSEGGAIEAVKNADVPILLHAYPDDLDKLGTGTRRDAFCGKFAIMNILKQYNVNFTALEPHAVHPDEPEFEANINYFSQLCLVVRGMKDFSIGAIGARTTPFKAVRYDEIALQKHGISVEAVDLTELFGAFHKLDSSALAVLEKRTFLSDYSNWDGVPGDALEKLAKLGVVYDQLVEKYELDAIALRCWTEIQIELGISPCVLVGEMNQRGVTSACETDVCSAVMMRALMLAGAGVTTSMDWNNNYGSERDKCILFHCGPVPESMLKEKGRISDHELLATSIGKGCSFGCDTGRLRPMNITFAGLQTIDGNLECYLGEGNITDDAVPANFFGAAGVVEIPNLQSKLKMMGKAGHRHHTNLTEGQLAEPLNEAFEQYLGYNVLRL